MATISFHESHSEQPANPDSALEQVAAAHPEANQSFARRFVSALDEVPVPGFKWVVLGAAIIGAGLTVAAVEIGTAGLATPLLVPIAPAVVGAPGALTISAVTADALAVGATAVAARKAMSGKDHR